MSRVTEEDGPCLKGRPASWLMDMSESMLRTERSAWNYDCATRGWEAKEPGVETPTPPVCDL